MANYRLEFEGHSYARIDALSINVCVAKSLSDAAIEEYMNGTLDAAGSDPTTLSLSLFLSILSRRFLSPHAMFDRVTVVGCAKVALAAAVMGLMVWAFLGIWGPRSTWTQHAVSLGASVALGGVTFLAAAIALRTHELRWLFHREA